MIAFEVYLNGKQICTAGIGDLGVLTAHVCWVRRERKTRRLAREELTMAVGGLITPTKEHIRWHEGRPVQVGDEVRIKIVEKDMVDQPPIRRRTDPVEAEQARKRYVREKAKELGWKLKET